MKRSFEKPGMIKMMLLLAALFTCLLSFAAGAASSKLSSGWGASGNYYYKDGKKVTGLQKIGKKQYYFGKNGKLVKDKRAYAVKVEGKTRYLSINEKGVATVWTDTAELAAKQLVALKANLNKVSEKRMKKSLLKAFLWAGNMRYRNNTVSKTGKAAAKYYGDYAFTKGYGDCNTQAYAFYWMAKVLGYKPKYVKGYVPVEDISNLKPHAWVTIPIGKKTYVFDPNFNSTHKSQFGKKTGFMFQYGDHHTYHYFNKKKKELQ